MVTIANGGDNIAVYVPLFAQRTVPEILLICMVFGMMTGLGCLSGKFLVSHPSIGKLIRRHAPRITPFVLIAIGIYILLKTWTLPVSGL